MMMATQSWALPADRQAPIEVQADNMTWTQNNQTAIYQGSVDIQQGELHLTSEQLTLTRNSQGKLDTLEATGDKPLAYFRDLPSPNKPPVEAWANIIHYDTAAGLIRLEGNARLTQGEDTIEGHKLTYDLSTQDIRAEQGQAQERVKIILTPNTASPSSGSSSGDTTP
ncbi:lipopolysaccharide transport periplasmic protein LptA [Terasakiispira papahanaumokuakeensis]|uniref:Lipopolysaccharide export system protein LptA n=1 Tax=Terasakiispira papahanaumokuakeensis TaxID=197479 RepID=A0A1E2V6N5_9GAMM|nr:lipopolysaccharide transport periplasmic protein LptA [Terasakiispira papahanaumokuakeensis]ODC02670.1 lipopolysaccharide transport periplasmic protein LptA [Terasakiispira papahanaumokuakeensis]